jgi:hypothetical protein
MNAPKHQDPSASVKIGWGTAAALAAVACAVLVVAVWGGLQVRRHASAGGRPDGGGQGSAGVSRAASPSTASPDPGACRHELRLGDRLAAAADASYRDWAMHVDAQLQLDRGRTTLAQTEAMWAASKARGAADVRRFRDARAAWERGADACSPASADQGSAPPVLQACVSRQAAVRAVATKGAKVDAQWAAHLEMMANKAHTDGAEYSRRWLQMVQDAPPVLQDYAGARRQLHAAPRCEG